MNRKEFCEYFGIPYRTMTDWELGNRAMPDYLLRLMAYKIKAEALAKNNEASTLYGDDIAQVWYKRIYVD